MGALQDKDEDKGAFAAVAVAVAVVAAAAAETAQSKLPLASGNRVDDDREQGQQRHQDRLRLLCVRACTRALVRSQRLHPPPPACARSDTDMQQPPTRPAPTCARAGSTCRLWMGR